MKQRSKAEIVEQIETEHGRLRAHLAALSEASLCQPGVRPTPEPGQSCKDVLGHLTAWEVRMRDCVRTFLATGTLPEYPATAEFNVQVYLARKDLSLEEAQAQFLDSYNETLDFIKALSEEDLARSPVWQLIGYNTYSHYKWASTVIRQWTRCETS
jgi:hypothetical protein